MRLKDYLETDQIRGALSLIVLALGTQALFDGVRSAYPVASPGHTISLGSFESHILFILSAGLVFTLIKTKARDTWEKRSFTQLSYVIPVVSAWCLSWQALAGSYGNPMTGQSFLYEKLALVLLNILFLFRPAFSLTLLPVLWVLLHQEAPFSALTPSFTDKSMPFMLLFSCGTYSFLSCFKVFDQTVYKTFLVMIIVAHYFIPGMAKLQLGDSPLYWVLNDRIDFLFSAAVARGWLCEVDVSIKESLYSFLASVPLLLTLPVFLFEVFAPLILLNDRKKLLAFFLFGCASLHLMIYLSSGICFWKWALVEIAGAVSLLLPRNRPEQSILRLNKYARLLLFCLLIFFLTPPKLGWLDAPLDTTYKIFLEDPEGKRMRLREDFFRPYDIQFAQQRFYYLSETPVLTDTYGAIRDLHLFEAMQKQTSPEEMKALLFESGENKFSEEKKEKLSKFLKSFVEAKLSSEEHQSSWASFLQPPTHIQSCQKPYNWSIARNYQYIVVERHDFAVVGGASVSLIEEEVLRLSRLGVE